MILSHLPEPRNGVHYLTPPKTAFEEVYIRLRNKEQRVHDDEFVKQLPVVPKTHPHATEWNIRRKTQERFCAFLAAKNKPAILDIGCGNGWFTAKMTPFASEIMGIDVGTEELEQAARCFGNASTGFTCCDELALLPEAQFDIITFNASIQYFEPTHLFWESLFRLLKPGGEIHLLDSPIYKRDDQQSARERSKTYFSEQQEPAAETYYFHLAWDDLPKQYTVRYRPNRLSRLLKKDSPFPWVVIPRAVP
ncbi:MAG TPA: class I SAM-dependent methyltransferase [Fluviicola sp.]|nr:class I SAM-dependent methyltransferase [Fluviicola sp.]